MQPAFLRELLEEHNLRKMAWGVPSGYLVTVTLVIFAVFFDRYGLLPNADVLIFYLAPFKLLSNTMMWWAIRNRRFVLELAGLNQLADVILLTAVIYFTGGPASPLTSLYFVVLAIIATLTNAGVTITNACLMVAGYAIMLILISAGVLEVHPPFLQTIYEGNSGISWELVVLDTMKVLTLMAIMVAAMSTVLNMLRNREKELEEKNRELRKADRLKSQFIANVTHELRTPIHGVMGLSEMLAEDIYGESNAAQKKAFENINRSAQNLLSLVDDLLALEQSSSWRLDLAETDLNELAREAKSAAQWMRGTRQLQIEVDLPDQAVIVVTDRKCLSHILSNLMANAVKFTPEQKSVTLRVASAPGGARIVVHDEGIGIPPEARQQIFDAFYQVDGSASRRFGGAGLGLSVVASLTDRLGIEIEVESSEGFGTRFELLIPERAPGVDDQGAGS